jgi:excisionase family DNA binding protein
MTEYNATVELQLKATEATAEDLMEALADYHVSVASSPSSRVEVTITLQAESLRQAVLTALAVVGQCGAVTALEVLPTAEFDRRAGLDPVPPLASVTEAAAALGITRQAVLSRISSGSLPAERVGSTYAIPRAALG